MDYEYLKRSDLTRDELGELEAEGWEFVGEVGSSGVMRFRREAGTGPPKGVSLEPLSVVQKAQTNHKP